MSSCLGWLSFCSLGSVKGAAVFNPLSFQRFDVPLVLEVCLSSHKICHTPSAQLISCPYSPLPSVCCFAWRDVPLGIIKINTTALSCWSFCFVSGFLTDDLVSHEFNGDQQKYFGVCRLGPSRLVRQCVLDASQGQNRTCPAVHLPAAQSYF